MNQTKIIRSPFGHMRRNAVAYLALFVALGGTSAYAANEWTGANIVDESLTGADIKNGSVASRDVTNGSLTGADVSDNTIGSGDITNGSLFGVDIANESIGLSDVGSQAVGSDEVANDSLLQSDIRAGAVTSDEVLDNTIGGADVNDNALTGADINESSLSLPPTTTATFAGVNPDTYLNNGWAKVASKNLPAGSYALIGTVNTRAATSGSAVRDVVCELRNGADFLGGAHDRRMYPGDDFIRASLTMTGGAQVPAGGGEVSMWCNGWAVTSYGHIMILRIDGFS